MKKELFNSKLAELAKEDKEFAAAISQTVQDADEAFDAMEKSEKAKDEALIAKGKAEAARDESETAKDKAEAAADESAAKIIKLDAANSQLKKDDPGLVEGAYTCKKGKNKGKKYQFKPGFLKFRYHQNLLISEEVIEDSKMMEKLIEMGFGGIETDKEAEARIAAAEETAAEE